MSKEVRGSGVVEGREETLRWTVRIRGPLSNLLKGDPFDSSYSFCWISVTKPLGVNFVDPRTSLEVTLREGHLFVRGEGGV